MYRGQMDELDKLARRENSARVRDVVTRAMVEHDTPAQAETAKSQRERFKVVAANLRPSQGWQ